MNFKNIQSHIEKAGFTEAEQKEVKRILKRFQFGLFFMNLVIYLNPGFYWRKLTRKESEEPKKKMKEKIAEKIKEIQDGN